MSKFKQLALATLVSAACMTAYGATEPAKKAVEPVDNREVLNVYNWPGYVGKDVISGFEKKYNVRVNYQEYDIPSEMHVNLFKGKTSDKDVVIMSLEYADKLSKSGFFEPINRNTVVNAKYLDPRIMRKVAIGDANLRYFIPYMWGTLGVGVNASIVKPLLGGELAKNPSDYIFNREITSKLKDCGISYMGTAPDMMALSLKQLGLPTSGPSDKDLVKASELMLENRQNVKQFSTYPTDDLAEGKICVAVGFSGDIIQAKNKTEGKYDIQYMIPEKGTLMWVDVMTIPKDSTKKDLANKFINYMLDPNVLSKNANEIGYVHANTQAYSGTDKKMMTNPALNPPSLNMVDVRRGLTASEQRNLLKYFNRVQAQE